MFTVNGQAYVTYPELLVHCEMLADEKLVVVNPDTVRAPLEFDSPEPKRLLKDELLTIRFVVEAETTDEYVADA